MIVDVVGVVLMFDMLFVVGFVFGLCVVLFEGCLYMLVVCVGWFGNVINF